MLIEISDPVCAPPTCHRDLGANGFSTIPAGVFDNLTNITTLFATARAPAAHRRQLPRRQQCADVHPRRALQQPVDPERPVCRRADGTLRERRRYLNDNPLLTAVQIGAFPNGDNFQFKCARHDNISASAHAAQLRDGLQHALPGYDGVTCNYDAHYSCSTAANFDAYCGPHTTCNILDARLSDVTKYTCTCTGSYVPLFNLLPVSIINPCGNCW